MENLQLYEAVRKVPEEALKEIKGGRLKGFSDINPMWRVKKLTEQFGPCGIGWKYIIKEKRLESASTGEIAAFVDIDLFYRWEGQWSEAIPGTGGSGFVIKERNGSYMSDECYKMALTDAISVACKALGIGADVYWQTDKSKYDTEKKPTETPRYMTEEKATELYRIAEMNGYDKDRVDRMVYKRYKKKMDELDQREFTALYSGFASLGNKEE